MIQPGSGYTLVNSSGGMAINIDQPWMNYDEQALDYRGFECLVYSETVDDVTKWYLKTRRGVANFNFSQFPFYQDYYSSVPTGVVSLYTNRRECIIKDFGVYPTGARTAGSDSTSDWLANDGRVEIKNAASGGFDTWVVAISKIDYYDKNGWDPTARLLQTTEAPFLSVYAPADTGGGPRNNAAFVIQHDAVPSRANVSWWMPNPDTGNNSNIQTIPVAIGYDFKKIAQLDWNATTESWDLTQYLTGPVWLNVPFYTDMGYVNDYFDPTDGTAYELFKADHFIPMGNTYNSDWFERLRGTISGYTINPSDWWVPVVT